MSEEITQETELPTRLVERLRKAVDVSSIDTVQVDQTLDVLAARHFRRRSLHGVARYGRYAALAASVALISLLVPLRFFDQWARQETLDIAKQVPSGSVPVLYADVDGSGQIDIADVLALARSNPGRFEQTDLDAFAFRVVSVNAEAGVGR